MVVKTANYLMVSKSLHMSDFFINKYCGRHENRRRVLENQKEDHVSRFVKIKFMYYNL